MENREWVFTVDQISVLLHISRGHAFAMVREGRIPSIRLGRRLLIPRKAIEDMLSGKGNSQDTKEG